MAAIIVLDFFLGVIVLVGLISTWDQLRAHGVKRSAKGVVLVVDQQAPRRKNVARIQVDLRMAGPAVRYEVGLDLEADGNRFDASTPKPAIRPSMGCDDEEMSWSFEIPEDDLHRAWVIASWVDAYGDKLRVAAIASSLSTKETYEWKRRSRWRLSGTGLWRRRRAPMTPPRAVPGLGPLESGRPPGGRRAPQPGLETDTDVEVDE